MNLFDFEDFDKVVFNTLRQLQTCANRKKEIEEMPSSSVDAETKSRLLATVMMPNHQMKIEQMGLVFTLPSYDHIELVKDGNNTNLSLENA